MLGLVRLAYTAMISKVSSVGHKNKDHFSVQNVCDSPCLDNSLEKEKEFLTGNKLMYNVNMIFLMFLV